MLRLFLTTLRANPFVSIRTHGIMPILIGMIRVMSPLSRIRLPVIDPRHYQACVQILLLFWGISVLQFSVRAVDIVWVLTSALFVQYAFTRQLNLSFNYLSSVNTALSILLLLRTESTLWLVIAAVLAISSKFLVRWRDSHLFNPSNFGIVALLLMSASAWAAPGQWGQMLWWALLLAATGLIAMLGVRQMLVTISFLLSYTSILLLRAFWLGDDWSIPFHQLQNGALLIFACFMLSDPKTTPASTKGRALYGVWIAVFSAFLQFTWYLTDAFLYALFFSSPLVVLLNRLFRSDYYQWPNQQG